MREIFKNVREKLVAKYLKNNSLKGYSKNTKKFKPRIKARIRKNKQIISKNIDTFFDWIKGAELVELKTCNVKEDPVRPELDLKFRTEYGRKIYGVKFKKEIPFNEVLTGQNFSKKLQNLPSSFLIQMLFGVLNRISPNMVADVTCPKPYLLTPLIAAAQTVHVCKPGQKPPNLSVMNARTLQLFFAA